MLSRLSKIVFISALFFLTPQFVLATTNRFSVIHFRPLTESGDYVSTYGSSTMEDDQWRVYSWVQYGYRPLEFSLVGVRVQGIIDHYIAQHFGVDYAINDNFQLNLDLPVIWYNDLTPPIIPQPPSEIHYGFGDLQFKVRLSVVDGETSPFGFGVVGFVNFPTGNENHYISDKRPVGGMLLVVDRKFNEKFSMGFNVGFEARERLIFNDLNIGTRLLSGLGAKINFSEYFATKLDVNLASPLNQDFLQEKVSNRFEGLLGFDFKLGQSGLVLSLGGRVPIIRSAGSPLYSGHLGLTYTFDSKK